MSETQKKLGKVRPPRVHITYDVEAGDSATEKELPLVIGVVGDFATNASPLRERSFIGIDKDNFDDVMGGMAPSVSLELPSMLTDHGDNFVIELTFNSINDFSPDNVARQIAPLNKLLVMREQLIDLRNRTASNERLKDELMDIIRQQNIDGKQAEGVEHE